MKYYISDRETGTFICRVYNKAEAIYTIEAFEEEDRSFGEYTPDFYSVVNENHETVELEELG